MEVTKKWPEAWKPSGSTSCTSAVFVWSRLLAWSCDQAAITSGLTQAACQQCTKAPREELGVWPVLPDRGATCQGFLLFC